MNSLYPPDFINKFLALIDKRNECWLWTGHRISNNIPMFYYGGKGYRVARLCYNIINGPIDHGLFLRKICDKNNCINPAHYKTTKEIILLGLKDAYNAGIPLDIVSLKKHGLLGLYSRAINNFGSFFAALEKLGINYNDFKVKKENWKDDPSKVLKTIKKLYSEGSQLNSTYIQSITPGLLGAAIDYYGGWDNALKRAGLDPKNIKLNWFTESHKGILFQNICFEIFKIIRPEWDQSFVFNIENRWLKPDLYHAPSNDWIDLKLCSYGISVDQSIKKYSQFASKLTFICLNDPARKNINNISFISIFDFENNGHDSDVKKMFADLKKLKSKNFNKVSLKKWERKWNDDKIIEEIKKLPVEHLSPYRAQKYHKALYTAVWERFDHWSDALRLAGIDEVRIKKKRKTNKK